jgi:hypothetical protein
VRQLSGCGSCTNDKEVEWGCLRRRGPARVSSLPAMTSVALGGASRDGVEEVLGFRVQNGTGERGTASLHGLKTHASGCAPPSQRDGGRHCW